MEYNVYCDESCHLEHDNSSVMTIGATYCPLEKRIEICKRIVDIKASYKVPENAEIKWTKISKSKIDMYKEIVNYFFDDDDLHFRCVIADKTHLNHSKYNQTHDDWYYKMYFDMLKVILDPQNTYNIYIDIKDSHSNSRALKLNEILRHSKYDYSEHIIKKVQPIRSEEVQIMQITDILTGAIARNNRTDSQGVKVNESKKEIIELIKKRSGYSLNETTLYPEKKMNLLKWEHDFYERH